MVFEFLNHLGYGAFMLTCEGFEATVFHEIGKVAQFIKIAGNSIVVADSPQFRIVGRNDFQICESQKRFTADRHEFPIRFLYRNFLGENEAVNLIIEWDRQFTGIVEGAFCLFAWPTMLDNAASANTNIIPQKSCPFAAMSDECFFFAEFHL